MHHTSIAFSSISSTSCSRRSLRCVMPFPPCGFYDTTTQTDHTDLNRSRIWHLYGLLTVARLQTRSSKNTRSKFPPTPQPNPVRKIRLLKPQPRTSQPFAMPSSLKTHSPRALRRLQVRNSAKSKVPCLLVRTQAAKSEFCGSD